MQCQAVVVHSRESSVRFIRTHAATKAGHSFLRREFDHSPACEYATPSGGVLVGLQSPSLPALLWANDASAITVRINGVVTDVRQFAVFLPSGSRYVVTSRDAVRLMHLPLPVVADGFPPDDLVVSGNVPVPILLDAGSQIIPALNILAKAGGDNPVKEELLAQCLRSRRVFTNGVCFLHGILSSIDHSNSSSIVRRLCENLSTTERTLRRKFNLIVGMSPKRFMRSVQLNLIRSAVVDGSTNGVTNVMTDYGLTELGRAAVQYKSLFGESPSVTFRNRASRSGLSLDTSPAAARRGVRAVGAGEPTAGLTAAPLGPTPDLADLSSKQNQHGPNEALRRRGRACRQGRSRCARAPRIPSG